MWCIRHTVNNTQPNVLKSLTEDDVRASSGTPLPFLCNNDMSSCIAVVHTWANSFIHVCDEEYYLHGDTCTHLDWSGFIGLFHLMAILGNETLDNK